jgi:hypothetical protein
MEGILMAWCPLCSDDRARLVVYEKSAILACGHVVERTPDGDAIDEIFEGLRALVAQIETRKTELMQKGVPEETTRDTAIDEYIAECASPKEDRESSSGIEYQESCLPPDATEIMLPPIAEDAETDSSSLGPDLA